jgi:hypothetical protein
LCNSKYYGENMREKFWDAIGFFGAAKEEGKAEKG